MMYSGGFNVAAISPSPGTLTLGTSGKPNIVITLSSVTSQDYNSVQSSFFFQHAYTMDLAWRSESADAGVMLQDWSKKSWAKALEEDLQAGATAQGWTTPSGLTAVMSAATGFFTIAYSVANFTMTWSSAVGSALCSFSGNQSGAQSYVGTLVPTYCIMPTLQSAGCPEIGHGRNYEPPNIATHVIADGGGGHGIARPVVPIYRDWVQQFETLAKTDRLSAAAAHPWTFQALFEHCRGQFPFLVDDGGFDRDGITEVFFLRSEGTSWPKDLRASIGNANQFHIPFMTQVVGEKFEP